MKLIRKRLLALVLAALCVFLTATTAYALAVPDLNRRCSVTFTMLKDTTPIAGGSLTIYRVGEVVENNGDYTFKATGAFAGCGETFTNLEDDEQAKRLEAYAAANSIAGLETKTIDTTGVVKFTNLSVGLYLLVQQEPAPGYTAIAPFLFSLPYLENGEYKYDMSAKPKTEPETEPTVPETTPPTTEPPTTTTPDEPDLPQTGQLWWPVPTLVCFGLALVAIGFDMTKRKKPDES